MLISKSGLPHRLYHKLDGVSHLKKLLESGKLANVVMDRFEPVSAEQLRQMVSDPNRDYPLHGRTSSLEDTTVDRWEVQPRKKFPTISQNPKVEKNVEEFIISAERFPEKLQIFAVHLPAIFTTLDIGMNIDHANGHYEMEVRLFNPAISNSADTSFRGFPKFYRESGQINQGVANVYVKMPEEYVNVSPVEIARECIPAVLDEFPRGENKTSEVRFVAYENRGNLVAYDWLLKDR